MRPPKKTGKRIYALTIQWFAANRIGTVRIAATNNNAIRTGTMRKMITKVVTIVVTIQSVKSFQNPPKGFGGYDFVSGGCGVDILNVPFETAIL
jgi:hypothetical protein